MYLVLYVYSSALRCKISSRTFCIFFYTTLSSDTFFHTTVYISFPTYVILYWRVHFFRNITGSTIPPSFKIPACRVQYTSLPFCGDNYTSIQRKNSICRSHPSYKYSHVNTALPTILPYILISMLLFLISPHPSKLAPLSNIHPASHTFILPCPHSLYPSNIYPFYPQFSLSSDPNQTPLSQIFHLFNQSYNFRVILEFSSIFLPSLSSYFLCIYSCNSTIL